jgi:hypothetical protein
LTWADIFSAKNPRYWLSKRERNSCVLQTCLNLPGEQIKNDMTVSRARTPINPAYKVRPYNAPDYSKKIFEAKWSVAQTAPTAPVKILAVSRSRIESKSARIEVFQLLDGRQFDVCSFYVPVVGGTQINYLWTADPVQRGDFEAGAYHFHVSAGLFWGETQIPLLIRDVSGRNLDLYLPARDVSKMPKF